MLTRATPAQGERARTAELVRQVLPLVSAHGADFGPSSYALWYAYASGGNAPLAAALDAVVTTRARLSPERTAALLAEHVLAAQGASVERVRAALGAALAQVSGAAAQTRSSSHALRAGIAQAADAFAPLAAEPAVAALAAQAQATAAALAAIEARLADSEASMEALREELARVREESMTDPLTRLANRRAFDEALARLIESAAPAGASLVLIDIDHFKRTNDAHGHPFGDRVLRAVAQALRAHLKGRDTVARFGGEEFAALLPDTTAAAARTVAEQLRAAVAEIVLRPPKAEAARVGVTVSCGVATLARGDDAAALIERADAALYAAKRRGRNTVVLAHELSAA